MAILISLPPHEARQVQKEGLQQMVRLGLPVVGRLQTLIQRSRRLGYAFNAGEVTPGIHSFGLPVLDPAGYPLAAVTLSGPAETLPASRAPEVLEEMRQAVSSIEKEARKLLAQGGNAS